MTNYIKLACGKLLLLLLISASAIAQPAFEPKKVSEAINSSYAEINPILSPDGNELFFVRANHPENGFGVKDSEDVWYSKRGEDGLWTEAVRIPELNIGRYNAVWAVTGDGSSVLIHGMYNKKGNLWKKRGFSLVSRDASGKWGKPVAVKVAKFNKKNRGLYTTAYLTPDKQHLLMSFSRRYNSKTSDLFVSKQKANGKYGKPKKLKMTHGDTEQAPFVSADGKQLFFSSNIFGSYDIMVADRLDDSWRKWSEPMLYKIKTADSLQWESYFRTNANGSEGWYSARSAKGSEPDIYSVKIFEANPFIVLSGQILNKQTNEPITELNGFQLFVNDTVANALQLKDGGNYTLKLPLGSNYQLKTALANHAAHTISVSADSLTEYTETTADLYLTPWNVVQVKGKLLEMSSQTALPEQAKAQLLVDGQRPDSLNFNAATGEFALWLPYGKNYQLQLQAIGYKPTAIPLQLDKVKAYKVVNQNLYANKISTAVVQGRLLDRKTGEKFAKGLPVNVVLNDTLELAVIDSVGTYEVKLPLGSLHTLSAKAEGYYPITEMIDLRGEDKSVKVYKDLYMAPVEVGQSIRLNNVFFETAKSALKPESFPELDRVVDFLKENPNMKIEIAGHTDNKGSASLNNKLSAARAEAVAKYIISKDIPKDKLTSRGYGSTKPEADNKTEEGRSKNRRVEFTILEIKN